MGCVVLGGAQSGCTVRWLDVAVGAGAPSLHRSAQTTLRKQRMRMVYISARHLCLFRRASPDQIAKFESQTIVIGTFSYITPETFGLYYFMPLNFSVLPKTQIRPSIVIWPAAFSSWEASETCVQLLPLKILLLLNEWPHHLCRLQRNIASLPRPESHWFVSVKQQQIALPDRKPEIHKTMQGFWRASKSSLSHHPSFVLPCSCFTAQIAEYHDSGITCVRIHVAKLRQISSHAPDAVAKTAD